MDPMDATAPTSKQNASFLDHPLLDWSDRRDWDFANRGFIAKLEDSTIRDAEGKAVWDLGQYDFLEAGDAPGTVNPSLWRQARLNMIVGLFKVSDRIYQVRGYDLSVMSFIEGDSGWIVIDPLVSFENATVSLELVQQKVKRLPVVAVIYTHSHVDHFGGVKGITTQEDVDAGTVRVIAPVGFLEAAITENVTAGPAMARRAAYMYGSLLPRGPRGQVDAGLGKMVSSGHVTLIEPTESIRETGFESSVDGVDIVFQVTPGTEAPAEMNFYFPKFKALCMAENCSHNLHNLLTLRGAQVRDPRAWAHYLNEAIELYSGSSEVVFTSHHWPVWGNEELVSYMKKQRDMYKYLHDQTVRMMNSGHTGIEIAETLRLPDDLAREWYNRGYYGSVSHNVKAIYQKYMGWFDGNPAHLHELPPVEAGRKYVDFMGGAEDLLSKARKAYDDGEYRWVVQVVNHLVFADPSNGAARDLQAQALEQLGYQSENATWRNFYLTGAMELREGVSGDMVSADSGTDIVGCLSPEMIFDFMGVHIDAEKAADKKISLQFHFTDSDTRYLLTLRNSVLNHALCGQEPAADVTISLERQTLNSILTKTADVQSLTASGQLKIEGKAEVVGELFSVMGEDDPLFDIVTP